MERVFTEQETQAIFEAEKILRSRGLIVDRIDGEKEYDQNFERISSYLELNQIPITVEMILRGCEQMRDQLHWLSQAEMAYNGVYRALSKTEQDQFGAWWFTSGKKYVEIDGDHGFENSVKILNWMKGRTFSNQTFDLAISNLASSQGLHLAQARQSSVRQGHEDDGTGFMPKSETNLSAKDHARRAHPRAAATPAPSQSNEPDASGWESLCLQLLRDGRHSQQSAMKQLFDNRGSKSWRALYAEMKALQKNYQRLFNPRAV